ncbi:MAG: AAA family ATPase [Planctomycetaceae bacterium]
MKVKDIQIDGFGVWSGLAVDSLPDTMTLFYGPNEAGKTTLMQFLRAMFYGFTPERRGRYLPAVYGGTPGGSMRVTGPGGGYQIRRHSHATDSGVVGQLAVTGQDGLAQGQHRLSSLLGQIDEAIFVNVFAIGIRELQELSTLDDTSAADELYKLSSGLDRVSLVDVMRSLRTGRKKLVGKSKTDDEDATVLAALISKREKLRDEVEHLTRGGRRWTELATQRRSQASEIDQLAERLAAWEKESRCVEIGSSVYESWTKRAEVLREIAETENKSLLPEDAPGQLVQIEAVMEERRAKLEEVKAKRRELRTKAETLPLSRRLIDLQGKIEAASEQATWVEALQDQISKLDQQIEKAKQQVEADAERLGMDAEDREALLKGGDSSLPDLSRQTLAALGTPAKQVKQSLFLLKQARQEAQQHQAQAEKLSARLRETLDTAQSTNLHDAMRQQAEIIACLRNRTQVEQHLEKLRRHFRDLEKESLELATNEAFPVERTILLFVPFLFGGLGVLYGLFNVFGWDWFSIEPDPTWGMMMIFAGMLCLFLWYIGRDRGYSSTSLDLEDCERQIDTLRRQIREVEAERDDLESRLPPSSAALETRLREAEKLHAELEEALPGYHSQQASLQASKAARSRANEAASSLKEARQAWSSTLQRLGLSDSMSPSSVRKLSEGYETVQASRRRLAELEDEREQRRRERMAIAKRIESLYLEALGEDEETSPKSAAILPGQKPSGKPASYKNASEDHGLEGSSSTKPRRRTDPLDQLHHLHEELSRQQHWIKRRRELKEQDVQYKRLQASHLRTIERCEQQRRSLWAKCGVATAEQFYEMVDTRAQLLELREKHAELEKQVRGIIGNQANYDDVAQELSGATAADLERRWETLTSRISQTQERIATLRTNQGELSQEMKQLGEDDRLAIAQLELGCTERHIASVVRRWQTLAMASCLLEDVCATFEKERQPETLREASSFLCQLTDGKYTRVWTPLGTNCLKIDSHEGQSLPLEVLSRGTREAVFIALRLSLAAAYARRGVMLPLILDDVLVNFDHSRAMHAARTLKTFAEMGHQVLMFTCHEHISKIFQEIDVQVRLLPPQGAPGRAMVLEPVKAVEPAIVAAVEPTIEPPSEEPVVAEQEVVEIAVAEEPADEAMPAAEAVAMVEEIEEAPAVVPMPIIRRPKQRPLPPVVQDEPIEHEDAQEPLLERNWYERDDEEWGDAADDEPRPVVEGIWERSMAWSQPNPSVNR